ncbi:MAG: aldo/keto reductase [Firmicutes bacterium]|nr:aldo/keto reductase [Bacillota bacterium]
MKYTDFKGKQISRLGFGTMRLPMDSEGNIDYEEGKGMVDYAIAHGITYFDTAYKYHGGESENFCREALAKRHPRESFFLTDKLPTWLCNTPDDAAVIFQEQLTKCGVEYFDFYLIHNVDEENWPNVIEQNMIEYLLKEKAAGRIRHLGLSVHCQPPLLREILEKYSDILEFVQIQLNYMDWDYINSKELYYICREFDKPMIIMEPVRGGMLANPLSEKARNILDAAGKEDGLSYTDFALGYVDQLEGVAWSLSGMSNLEQMQQNIEFYSGEGLKEKHLAAITEASKVLQEDILVPCTGCNYCDECPSGIKIPVIFENYNEAAAKGFNWIWGSLTEQYQSTGANAKDCIECGNCESHCPQSIKIIKTLKEIDAKYEELKKQGK